LCCGWLPTPLRVEADPFLHTTVRSLLLGREEEHVNVGEDTTGGNGGGGEELGELFVVADSELNVAGHNSGLLVVLGGVACELEDLSGEVLKDGGEVHGGTGTDALSEASLLEVTGDSSDGELESSLGGSAHGSGSSLSFSS